MRTSLSILILFLYGCSISNGQEPPTLNLSYKTISGEVVYISDSSYYDIENKPVEFLLAYATSQKNALIIIDIYRIMSPNSNQCSSHYFKTQILSLNPTGHGLLNIKDMFELDNNRFYLSKGFKIKICVSSTEKHLKIVDEADCIYNKEFVVLYGE